MEIYRLTGTGEMLAHNRRPQVLNARWRIVYHLNRNGATEKSALLEATGASSYDISFLASKKVIVGNQGVTV